MFATRQEASDRLRICFSCDEITEHAPRRCRQCQCYMRAKVQLRNASCPKGHWGAGRFVADPASSDPAYWSEENAIIDREMENVAPEDAEYALSKRWADEAQTP